MGDPYQFRNPDGTLRLDELLGERAVRHYTAILGSSSSEFAAMQLTMGDMAPEAGHHAQPAWREDAGGWTLIREGAFQVTASSCQDVATWTCWDVCGYYGRLGIRWHAGVWRTTSQELRVAYLEVNTADKSEPIRYALMQLRDQVIRRAYDMMPFGGLFLGDRTVREMIERAAAREAARQAGAAHAAGEEPPGQERVLRDWGFQKEGVSAEEARERLSQFRQGEADDELGSSIGRWERSWGWYRLCLTGEPSWAGDAASRLEQWQAMVAGALGRRGIRMEFAVGAWPGSKPRTWRNGNESCIIFLMGNGRPTPEMADEAVRGYVARDY